MHKDVFFIAHAKEDRIFALRVISFVEWLGLECWIDEEDIVAGGRWNQEIIEAIETCTALLVIVSGASVKSDYVQAEVQAAFEHGKMVLSLIIEEGVVESRTDLRLRIRQRIVFETLRDDDPAWGQVAEGLEASIDARIGAEPDERRTDGPLAVATGDERPLSWEWYYLSVRVSSEMAKSASLRRDLSLGIPGATVSSLSVQEMLSLLGDEMQVLRKWIAVIEPLANEFLPVALGPDGQDGDREKLAYFAESVGRTYRAFLDWGLRWRGIFLSDYEPVLEELVGVASLLAADMERFRDDLAAALVAAREYDGDDSIVLKVRLTLSGFNSTCISSFIEEYSASE